MKIEVNKVITLGNQERYLVISHVDFGGKDYYYIAEVNDSGDDIKDNYKIVVQSEDNGHLFLDEVVGEANLKSVLPLFVKSIS